MQLNLVSRFAVQDVRPVPDPFGFDITFYIRRIGVKQYQEYAKKRLASNPFHGAVLKAQMVANMAGAKPTDEEWAKAKASGEGLDELKEREARYNAALERLSEKEMDKVNIATMDISRLADPEGIATHLIADIEGLTDEENGTSKPVKYTPAVGAELLSSTVPISQEIRATNDKGEEETVAEIGTHLGLALISWVLHEANLSERYRAAFVEEAEGN